MGSFTKGYCMSCWPVVDAAKRDLAAKVLAAIDNTWRWPDARLAVVRLLTTEGINLAPLTARQEKEGESNVTE